MTCSYCGIEFTDGDTPVEISGELVHRECDRHAQALEATWGGVA